MKVSRLFVPVLALTLAASLASGFTYASFVVTDNATPFGVKLTPSIPDLEAGYYLVGNSSFTGDEDAVWTAASGLFMGSESPIQVTLNIAADSEVKIAHYSDTTYMIDEWFSDLSSTVSSSVEQLEGGNIKFNRTSNYTISLNGDNEIEIIDNNQIVEEDKYYLEFATGESTFALSGSTKGTDGGSDLSQWLHVSVSANTRMRAVYCADGYAETTIYGSLDEYTDTGFVSQNDGFVTFTYSSTYSIYLTSGGALYIGDDNETPYSKDIYYASVNSGSWIASGSEVGMNHGQWLSTLSIAANDVVDFKVASSNYALGDVSYTLGRDYDFVSIVDGKLKFTRASNTYQIYLNGSNQIWINDSSLPAEGYYFLASSQNVYSDGAAVLNNQEVTSGDTFKVASYSGGLTSYLSLASTDVASQSSDVITVTGSQTYVVRVVGDQVTLTDVALLKDYYLSGTFNSWATKDGNYKLTDVTSSMTAETGKIAEYCITGLSLSSGDEFKVTSSAEEWFGIWEADRWGNVTGENNNYWVPMTSNSYSVYFKIYSDGSTKAYVTAEKDILFFKPNVNVSDAGNNWTSKGAKFYAALWAAETESNKTFVQLEDAGSGYYKLENFSAYTKLIIVRVKPDGVPANDDWEWKWNQSGDIDLPLDNTNTNNCITNGAWDYWTASSNSSWEAK